jgi:hypothetical protein
MLRVKAGNEVASSTIRKLVFDFREEYKPVGQSVSQPDTGAYCAFQPSSTGNGQMPGEQSTAPSDIYIQR